MSTTFQLQELAALPSGRYRLDTAAGSSTPAAGMPVLTVKAGWDPPTVRNAAGLTVLYAKRLGRGDAVAAGFTPIPVAAVAAPVPTPAAGMSQAAVQDLITTSVNALVAGAPGALDTLLELANQFTTDETAAAALTALVGTKMPVVVHGSTAGTARPTSTVPVLWVGTVVPTNATQNDLLVDTSVPVVKVRGASSFAQAGGTSVAPDPDLYKVTTFGRIGAGATEGSGFAPGDYVFDDTTFVTFDQSSEFVGSYGYPLPKVPSAGLYSIAVTHAGSTTQPDIYISAFLSDTNATVPTVPYNLPTSLVDGAYKGSASFVMLLSDEGHPLVQWYNVSAEGATYLEIRKIGPAPADPS